MADYGSSLSAPARLHQKLRRIATFGTFGRQNEDDEDSPSFLPRLGKNSVASEEQNKVQWLHLREVVMETIENPKHSDLSIRRMCVDSFKEHILIPLYDKLLEILTIVGQTEKRQLRSIFLIMKGPSGNFSTSKANLQLEKLITSVTTSYLGYQGIYENSSLVSVNVLRNPHRYKSSDNFTIHSQQPCNQCITWNPTVETLEISEIMT